MTNRLLTIDQGAACLLLRIAETGPACVSTTALEQQPLAARALFAAGLLREDGHETAHAPDDGEDEPVNLDWHPERQAYGYFSRSTGWTPVAPETLKTYRIDFSMLLSRLAARLDKRRWKPVESIPGILWELGDLRLPKHDGLIPLWFARRVRAPQTRDEILQRLCKRPPASRRLVLTTGKIELGQHRVERHDFVSVLDAHDDHTGLVIEPAYLAAQIGQPPGIAADQPVRQRGNFRRVFVGTRAFQFGGDKQRQIVEYLHRAWAAGEEPVSAAAMMTDLEFDSRVRDIFKGHPDWKDLIETTGGTARLRVHELLQEQAD